MNIVYSVLQGLGIIFVIIAIFVIVSMLQLFRRNNRR